MKIGVPAEVKNNEYRVGLTPKSVAVLTKNEHSVYVQHNAGAAIGFSDEIYVANGATILLTPEEVFGASELIVKVKEPTADELPMLTEQHTLFTYLHLAGNKNHGYALTETGVTGIAYETVTSDSGSLPLLAPMSAIAGQLSIIVGSYHLLKHNKGMGTLLGSFGEVEPRTVTIIGAGVAGTEAIKKSIANDAFVKIIDLSEERLGQLKEMFGTSRVEYIKSTESSIAEALKVSDLVVGSVYVTGKQAPKIVTRSMLQDMQPGSVMVDISIDQGGCFESSRPTNHDDPTFIESDVVHYCVTNMPGAVPLTASQALNQATLPFIVEIANKGVQTALQDNQHLKNGLNVSKGEIVHSAVKEAFSA